jgi:hypothetical protein
VLAEANANHRETKLYEQGFIFSKILKIVPKAASFYSCFPSLSLVDIFPRTERTFMVGFRKNFPDHRRLSERLLESHAALGKPEQAP